MEEDPCYIISVGRYGAADVLGVGDTAVTTIANTNELNNGLTTLRKVDEPTLIIFPDATRVAAISDTDFYSLYNSALTQCNELQDRFTIMDTLNYDAVSPTDANIGNLRSRISSEKDYLKYGAAYYPYLATILDYRYDEASVNITHLSDSANATSSAVGTSNESLISISALITGTAAMITDFRDCCYICNGGSKCD